MEDVLSEITFVTTDLGISMVQKISDGCYLTMSDDHVFQFFILLPSGEVMDAIEVNKR